MLGKIEKVTTGEGISYAKKTLFYCDPTMFNTEYNALPHLAHPGIVKPVHANRKHLYMEYVEGSKLQNTPLTIEESIFIFIQTTEALSYVHNSGYSHGDIHDGNILVSPNKSTAKLIDFGQGFRVGQDEHYLVRFDITQFSEMLKEWIKQTEFPSNYETKKDVL